MADIEGPAVIIYQCPAHPKFITVCFETDHGGTRMLGGKCCGQQYQRVLKAFMPDAARWREMSEACADAAEEIE